MSQFNFLIENTLIDLKEARAPKSVQYSNIEIDASAFAEKLKSGEFDELINAWSTKTWLGGKSPEQIRALLTAVADDLVEYPPSTYLELWEQIEIKVRESIPTRKDLVQKMTRVIANLLSNPAWNLIKIVEAPAGGSEPEGEEGEESNDISDLAEKAFDFIAQAEEPTPYADVVRYITGSFAKEESEAAAAIEELIKSDAIERDGDLLKVKESTGSKLLDVDDEDESESDRSPLEYDPDVAAAFKDYASSNDFGDNYGNFGGND